MQPTQAGDFIRTWVWGVLIIILLSLEVEICFIPGRFLSSCGLRFGRPQFYRFNRTQRETSSVDISSKNRLKKHYWKNALTLKALFVIFSATIAAAAKSMTLLQNTWFGHFRHFQQNLASHGSSGICHFEKRITPAWCKILIKTPSI